MKNKKVWEQTPEEYAREHGVEKPLGGIGLDISPTQLSGLSNKVVHQIFMKKIRAKQAELEKYKSKESEWKKKVWKAYKEGHFKLRDVYDNEAFYYVLGEITRRYGRDKTISPFRLSRMPEKERNETLDKIDSVVHKVKKRETFHVG